MRRGGEGKLYDAWTNTVALRVRLLGWAGLGFMEKPLGKRAWEKNRDD